MRDAIWSTYLVMEALVLLSAVGAYLWGWRRGWGAQDCTPLYVAFYGTVALSSVVVVTTLAACYFRVALT